MKIKLALLISIVAALPAGASVTMSTQFGTAYTQGGVAVPNGTLWALVVNTDADSDIAGMGLDSSLTALGAEIFKNVTSLNLNTLIGGDTVFALGGFNGALPGVDASSLTLNYGVNGLAAARSFGFFYFPGVLFSGTDPIVSGSSPQDITGAQTAGGFHTSSNDGIFDVGMVLPSDGALVSTGWATLAAGGTNAESAGFAQSIPEPSAALLGVLAAFGLLRRRRI